jgi:hypothetical protein
MWEWACNAPPFARVYFMLIHTIVDDFLILHVPGAWALISLGLQRFASVLFALLFISGVVGTGAAAQSGRERALTHPEFAQSQIQDQLRVLPTLPGRPFAARPASDAERAQSTEYRVRRSRVVDVDATYLNQMLEASPIRLDDQGRLIGQPMQMVFNPFDDIELRVVNLETTRNDQGLLIWRGGVVGDAVGAFTAVLDNGRLTANFTANGRQFTVFPLADGTHKVREVGASSRELFDPTSRPKNDAIPTRPLTPEERASGANAPSTDRERASATQVLRILVTYTPRAATDLPNMQSAVALAIADLNTTFTNSGIDARAELVGLERTSYSDVSKTDNQILEDAAMQVGDFARIWRMRAVVQADLIAVLANYGNTSCGLGYLNDTIDELSSTSNLSDRVEYGVSLTSSSGGCLPGTFTHEVGHNMGSNHDRFVMKNPVAGPEGYNYGYVDTTGRFQDVMAYNDECDSLNISCVTTQYFSNPSVTYNGRPMGIADNNTKAANNSRKIRAVLPNLTRYRAFLTQPTTPMLAVVISGTGTVSSSVSGISNCGSLAGTCAASFSGNPSVTLTPTAPMGSTFTGWSGACSGTGACTVSMSTSRSVTASFSPSLRLATVYSSAQSDSQSFLRFANTGSAASTVSVTLADNASGQHLGTWTSPSIPVGAAAQYQINTIESALPAGTNKPQFYAVAVQTEMTGYIQHVLYRPFAETFTNLSTCDSGVTANARRVANVHSSLLVNNFPSTLAITNTGTSAATATLGIFDSTNGARLGTYNTASIPAAAQVQIGVTTIQTAVGLSPSSSQFHYTFVIENSFTGSIQHLVTNTRSGVITDMTTTCAYGTVTAPASTLALRQPGPIFSSAQSSSQSFLRFFNTGTTSGTVNVALANSTTGASLGNWTSPVIPAGASKQFLINVVDSVVPTSTTKPQFYATTLQSQISGFFQHVLWRPADGTLTNLSTCEAGVTTSAGNLINVHSSILDFGYPSSVVVSNPTTSAFSATLGIFDSETGARRGTYTTPSIAAGGRIIIPITTIQNAIGFSPSSSDFHYAIRAEGTFNGFLQHLVTNTNVGVVTDMTTMCQLPATAVSYTGCSTTTCTLPLNTPTAGQLKRPGGFENYRVALVAGTTYTIEVKGASTSDGTLARPYLYVSDPNFNTVNQSGTGGTGNNIRLTMTPSTSGNYFLQVTAYIYDNNGGTFTISVTN